MRSIIAASSKVCSLSSTAESDTSLCTAEQTYEVLFSLISAEVTIGYAGMHHATIDAEWAAKSFRTSF